MRTEHRTEVELGVVAEQDEIMYVLTTCLSWVLDSTGVTVIGLKWTDSVRFAFRNGLNGCCFPLCGHYTGPDGLAEELGKGSSKH